jgi:hypothetical protein
MVGTSLDKPGHDGVDRFNYLLRRLIDAVVFRDVSWVSLQMRSTRAATRGILIGLLLDGLADRLALAVRGLRQIPAI